MTKYCAFLRGVNVNGTRMQMKDVCKVFAGIGLQNVASILATGNILFETDENPEDLKLNLEKAMSSSFNYDAHLFIKTETEIQNILNENPFTIDDNFHNYVFVGTEIIGEILIDNFNNCKKNEREEAKLINNNFYWKVIKGETLNSEFGKILGKKSLKNEMTSRNLNTFEKILQNLNKNIL